MTIVEELDQELAKDWGGQLWEEWGFVVCAELVRRLSEDDINGLIELARHRDKSWVLRAISLTLCIHPSPVLNWLVEKAADGDMELALAAADSLYSHQLRVSLNSSLLSRFERIAADATSGIDRIRAKRFLAMIRGEKVSRPFFDEQSRSLK